MDRTRTPGANPVKENPNNILIDYKRASNQFLGVRFIFECGTKLSADPTSIATAANLFHRFFQKVTESDYDIYLIGITSLFLAGKIEGQILKIRDCINVAYATIHRNSPPLELDSKYWAFRDSISSMELLMMRVLSFQVMQKSAPHKFLVHYLKTLEEWVGFDVWRKMPVSRISWAILQDFHHDSSILNYQPQAIAVASIHLACMSFGGQLPLCKSEGKNSWQKIVYPEIQYDIQDDIMIKMLEVYEKEAEILPKYIYSAENENQVK